jgi:molecular chaperone GrpE
VTDEARADVPADELGDAETVAADLAAGEDAGRESPFDDGVDEAASAVQADLDALIAQRDEYLGLARRVQADFENFRKRSMKQGADERERGASEIVERLLPVLDACDGALTHGHDDVKPIYDVLMDVLEKEGLQLLYPAGESFDPNVHEAVLHEPGEPGETPIVTEVLRSGYIWKGRVLRAAMVKVKG